MGSGVAPNVKEWKISNLRVCREIPGEQDDFFHLSILERPKESEAQKVRRDEVGRVNENIYENVMKSFLYTL